MCSPRVLKAQNNCVVLARDSPFMELEKRQTGTNYDTSIENVQVFEKKHHNFEVEAPRAPQGDITSCKYSHCMVAPEKPLEERWITLSVLDRFILPIFIPIYFIYESIPEKSFEEFVSKLKSSLAEVLVPFYTFSGRLQKSQATGLWDLYCDNEGVEFRVAHYDEELRKTCYSKPCLELRLLAPKMNAVPKDGGNPVRALCVQVTRFKCGAVALGCSFHHQLGDAYAVSFFTRAWSQLARGETMDAEPVHDRSSVIPEDESVQQGTNRTVPAAPTAIVGIRGSRNNTDAGPSVGHPSEEEDEDDFKDGKMDGYLFDEEAIAKLKRMSPGATSFEAVTAFIARHVIRANARVAKKDATQDDNLAKFVLMVDFRGRIGAPRFAGNAALPMAVIRPRPDFLGGDLVNSWAPVHAAVLAADRSYYGAFIRHAGRGPPSKERALAVSSCSRLPLYTVDFGTGAPSFSGILPPVPRLVPEFLLLLPPRNGAGFVAYLQLHKDVFRAVEVDPEFILVAKKYRPLTPSIASRL